MPKRILILALVLIASPWQAFAGVDASNLAGDSEQADLPAEFVQAIEQFVAWRDSLDSLRVIYTWEDAHRRRSRNQPAEMSCRTELKWQDWWVQGDSQKMRAETWRLDNAPSAGRTVTGRTASLQYFAEYGSSSRTPRLLTATDLGAKKTLQVSEQMPLYPIYFATTDWFSSSFERMPLEYAGSRIIDGCRCVGIQQDGVARPIMWLDLDHGGMPRLIEPTNNVTRWTWECDEFLRLENGSWFPKSGRYGFSGRDKARFEVEVVQINCNIPASDFETPAISKGTYVRDMTAGGVELKMVSARDGMDLYSQATPFAWWRIHCSFGMLMTSAGWLGWRRHQRTVVAGC